MDKMSRAFLLQDFESLSDFRFTFGAFMYVFFEGRSLSENECSSSDGLEVLRLENDTILIIVDVSDLVFRKT